MSDLTIQIAKQVRKDLKAAGLKLRVVIHRYKRSADLVSIQCGPATNTPEETAIVKQIASKNRCKDVLVI